jgi:DNA adenine methylase
MLLNRLGSKKMVIKTTKILELFPKHDMFIDMFFGAGGLFFGKPKAKYNICNDKDSDVFNLFQVVQTRKSDLEEAFIQMPIHHDLFQYWRNNHESDPILRAIRFLMLSNFGFMGKTETLRFGFQNQKSILYNNIQKTFNFISNVQFTNFDFRDLLQSIPFRHGIKDKGRSFIYADPPYQGTDNNYAPNCQFNQNDTIDLFKVLVSGGIRFAISEFDNPIMLDLAREYKLHVTYLGQRRNLGNRRNEILIHNYQVANLFNSNLF